MPKNIFTNPRIQRGTFFTTTVINPPNNNIINKSFLYYLISISYFTNKNNNPTRIRVQPIRKSQPERGNRITSSTPIPKPIKHVAKSFFKIRLIKNSFINNMKKCI